MQMAGIIHLSKVRALELKKHSGEKTKQLIARIIKTILITNSGRNVGFS